MMNTLARGAALSLFLVGLAGCGGGSDAPSNVASEALAVDTVTPLEEAYGGADGLKEFFDTHSADEIAAVLKTYGMGYRVHAIAFSKDGAVEKITDCNQYFPNEDRNIWHNFNSEYYYIDASGRPNRAYADLPPINKEPRIDSCQTKIGRWGDAEDPSNDYDGGHLIGAQLGGWGGRANIVPQDANFNRGRWVELENKMAKCGNLPNPRLRYSISVSYANSSNLVPSNFEMSVRNRATNSSVTMRYLNQDGGGPNGASENARGLAFLTENGC
jgi:DNA/RNA non-specific endonuclease